MQSILKYHISQNDVCIPKISPHVRIAAFEMRGNEVLNIPVAKGRVRWKSKSVKRGALVRISEPVERHQVVGELREDDTTVGHILVN
jgi:hypothetical protein